MRTKVFTALIAGLMLALAVGFRGDAARAQQKGGNDNASQSSQKSGQTKHVFVGRGSDTAQGSRVTIKSDNPLNDYSAYRSGDRFYVVLPRAAAGSVARGGSGKGYSDMQVQQRGDSVVLSYRVQPGAKPRVEQKFNRLDVVFDAPEGGQSNAAQTGGAQNAGGERNPNEGEGSNASGRNAAQNQQTNAAQNSSAQGDRRNPDSTENARQQQNAGAQNSAAQNPATQNAGSQGAVVPPPVAGAQTNGVEQNPAATTEASPAAAPTVDQSEVARNQQPNPVAPITTTNTAPGTATGVSFGTYVLNHWPVALFVALFVVGLGLIIASRRAGSTQPDWLEESKAAGVATLDEPRTAKLKDAPAESSLSATPKASAVEVAKAPDAAPLVAASALATAPAVVKVGKESRKNRKAKKKQEARGRKKQAAEALLAETAAARAAESQAVAEQPAAEAEVAAVADEATSLAVAKEAARPAVDEAAAVEPVAAEPTVVESQVAESPVANEQAAVVEPPVLTEQPVAAGQESAENSFVAAEPSVESRASETTAAEPSEVEPSPAPTAEPPVAPAESVAAVEPVADAATITGVAALVETAVVPAVEKHEAARDEAFKSTELEVAQPEAQADEVRQAEERQAEVKQVEARQAEVQHAGNYQVEAGPSTEIASTVAHDPEAAQAEARRLIEGGEYDRALLSTSDSMARQMVAYELLAALATRNFERRERARKAFVEHGYFEETARDLREAEAPAERAAAARALALVGSRNATPQLVAALEDPSVDVRRAAVEALGSLRDPAAIAPLEALIPRERQLRNGIPSRIIRNAIEPCRDTAEQEQAAAEQAEPVAEASPATDGATSTELAHVESLTTELTPAESAQAEAVATEVAAPAVDEDTLEVVPTVGVAHDEEATHEVEAHAPATETPVASGETTAVLPFESAPEAGTPVVFVPVSEATTEIAPLDEPARHASAAESELKALEVELEDFGGFAPPDEAAHAPEAAHPGEGAHVPEETHSVGTRAIEVSRGESEPCGPATTSEIEHVADEVHAAETSAFEFYASEPSVVEERSLQHVAEPETVGSEEVPARSADEASEWFEFDVDEKSFEPEPTAVEPSTQLFESSSGEALSSVAQDIATHADETRAVAPSGAVEGASTQIESRREPAFAAEESRAQAGASEEKGVVPFDEFSTVPASIQQRLASLVPSERAAAITELSHVDSDEAFQQICAAFDDDAKEVRSAAARALYDLREDRADSFTRALREATPERRRHVGSAISTSGIASEAISQLTGESREKTYESFSLLFLMAKAGEVQPLIRAIEGHSSSEVRLAVVKLLALSGQKEILPSFRRLAVRGSLPTEVRSALMEAIYQISSSGQPVA